MLRPDNSDVRRLRLAVPFAALARLTVPRPSAMACAVSASSMAVKQRACGIAVSVRSRTSRDELAAVGQFDVVEQSMRCTPFAVDEDEMVDARPPGDVDIFAQLDVALGAER